MTDKVPVYGVEPEAWMTDPNRSCVGLDPNLFFRPLREQGPYDPDWDMAARAVCWTCPFRQECAEYAMVHHLEGVWGGTTDEQRRSIKRRRQLGTTKECTKCGSDEIGPRFKAREKANHMICGECGTEFKLHAGGSRGGSRLVAI